MLFETPEGIQFFSARQIVPCLRKMKKYYDKMKYIAQDAISQCKCMISSIAIVVFGVGIPFFSISIWQMHSSKSIKPLS